MAKKGRKPKPEPEKAFLGVPAHMFGSGTPDSPATEWPTPDGGAVDDPRSALAAVLEHFSLESIVITAAGLSALMSSDSPKTKQQLARTFGHPSQLPWFLARRLITEAVLARTNRGPTDGVAITPQWFQKALVFLMDIDAEEDRGVASRESLMPKIHRLMQASLHEQLGVEGFHREWWIIEEAVRRSAQAGIDIEAAYRKKLGIGFTELASLSFGVYSAILGSPTAPLLPIDWGVPNPFGYSRETVDAFLWAVALNYEQFGEKATREKVVLSGYENFALSPLFEWPLVILSDGRLAAPSVTQVLERVTGVFKVEMLQVLGKSAEGEAGRILGEVYEDYVFDTLGAVLGSNVQRVPKVPNVKSCDFVVCEDNVTLLIEAKALHFPLEVEMTKSPEALGRFFRRDGGLADAVLQLEASVKAIKAGSMPGRERSYIAGLVVMRGEAIFMNVREVKKILLEVATEKNKGQAPTITFQIANDLDFQSLIHLPANGLGMGSWLYDKATAGGKRSPVAEMDIAVALSRLRYRQPHPLRKKMAEHFDSMLRRAGFEPGAPDTSSNSQSNQPLSGPV